MTELDEHGRPEPPVAADEVATLLGFLDWQRATLAWKCSGLEAAGLRATTAASMMTLGGILKHMALVEDAWFSRSLHGREYAPPWDAVDWTADHDWEWRTAAEDSPEELFALWERAVEQSRADVAEVLDSGDGLGRLAKRTWPDGRSPSLRWILCHGSRPRIALALRIAASGGRYGRSTTVMMRRPSRGRDLSRSRRADSADDPWVGAREAWLGELVAPLSGLTSPNSAHRSRLAGAVNIRMMASRQGLHESRGNGPPWLSGRIPGCRAGLAGCGAEMLWSAFRPVSVRAAPAVPAR